MSFYKKLTAFALFTGISLSSHASLIGQWTFDDLTDSTGNWNPLTLRSGATLDNGRLDLSSAGLQWANTTWNNSLGYDTGSITNKTLVSWVELTSLTTKTGAALTLDSSTVDNFNGLIWSENYGTTWQVGSSYGRNNGNLGLDASGVLNRVVQVAATWAFESSQVNINYFIDGVSVGSYLSNQLFSWQKGNAEAIFGARHTTGVTNPIVSGGGLDGYIYEARIYDTALSQEELRGLSLTEVPEPGTLAIVAVGLLGLIRLKRRSTSL